MVLQIENLQKVTKDVLSIVCKKLHAASTYKVSEMVKSIENAYRHMDITLANQLSLAFPKDNIREVLKLVGTKWNVEAFHPELGQVDIVYLYRADIFYLKLKIEINYLY